MESMGTEEISVLLGKPKKSQIVADVISALEPLEIKDQISVLRSVAAFYNVLEDIQ